MGSISWLIASPLHASYPHTYKLAVLQLCRIFTGLRFMCSLMLHHRLAHQAFALSRGHPSIYPFSITSYPTLRVAGVDGVHPGCLGAKSDKSSLYHRANTVRQTSHTYIHTYRHFGVAVYPRVFGKSLQAWSREKMQTPHWKPRPVQELNLLQPHCHPIGNNVMFTLPLGLLLLKGVKTKNKTFYNHGTCH